MRTFIAIEFPDPVRQQLDATCAALRHYLAAQKAPNCLRWASMHNAHLTLRFLGETTPAQAHLLAAHLRDLAHQQPPFALALGGIGGFPHLHQPRVLWLGPNGDLAQLHTLQRAVEQMAQRAGFAAEARPYAPHITLARAQRRATKPQLRLIGQGIEAYASTDGEEAACRHFPVAEIVHMQSELQQGGAVYTPLARFPLAG